MYVAQVKSMEANRPYIVMADEDVTFGTTNETLVPVALNRPEQETTPNYALLGTFAPIFENLLGCFKKSTISTNSFFSSSLNSY